MQAVKDASGLYEVERRAIHAERPGFRITELQIGAKQKVPWHCHSNVKDTFYVLAGKIRIFLREPKEEVRLEPGETYTVKPKRPHLVTNAGDDSAVFLVLQGVGEYDFVPLA
jgi:quercetin dioxygenase-like cupin family protein